VAAVPDRLYTTLSGASRAAQAVYRIRSFRAGADRPKSYQSSFEVSDEHTGQVLASCDLMGKAAFTVLDITDHDGGTWHASPNRKVMPSRWVVTDPGQETVVQLDAKIAGKLLNPLYRTSLAVLDSQGNERYRLLDPRAGIAERILGVGPDDWAFVQGDELAARLVMLPRQGEPPSGLLGRIAHIFAGADRGLVSAGPQHILPAPAVLAIAAIHDELTNVSGE
jgi:hypothetical protein